MKEVFKPRTFRHYLVVMGGIFTLMASVYAVWLIFPASVNRNEKVVKVEEQKKSFEQKAQVKKIPKPSVPVALVPDYTIPPVVNGMAPVISTISTSQNIVFLTIDDGAFKDQSVIDIIKQNNIKASLFLAKTFISSKPTFFNQITSQGSSIEDHSLTHDINMYTSQTYDQQKAEICGMADYEQEQYGRRPVFFRPPGGSYSDTMRQAAADCGMKAVVTWVAKANGDSMQYQVGSTLRPGDIVLMHFRPEFKQDMQAFLDAMNAAGLHTALLEDAI